MSYTEDCMYLTCFRCLIRNTNCAELSTAPRAGCPIHGGPIAMSGQPLLPACHSFRATIREANHLRASLEPGRCYQQSQHRTGQHQPMRNLTAFNPSFDCRRVLAISAPVGLA